MLGEREGPSGHIAVKHDHLFAVLQQLVEEVEGANVLRLHRPFVEMDEQALRLVQHDQVVWRSKRSSFATASLFNKTFIKESNCTMSFFEFQMFGYSWASK